MTIYRHKSNKKLYTIEHLIRDIHHLNNNEFAGIYAFPYKWNGDTISMKSKSIYICQQFVEQTFTKVSTANVE